MTPLMKTAAIAVVALVSSGNALATVLYGTTNSGGGAASTLLTIDATTGATTVIGAIGYTVNGLTYDSSTGTLYGSARADGGLLTIDTTTGAGSLVGAFDSGASGCSSRNVLLTSNSGGDLYGWCDPSSDDLMSIDKTTGKATIVGESGIGTGSHGMAFDNNDDLYLFQFGENYSVDTTTGAATQVGDTGGSEYSHHGDFNPDDNLYYGVGDDSTCCSPRGVIGIFDLVGGTSYVSSLTLDRSDVFTLAFAADRVPPVPEPATLALMGLGLAGLGLRRRRQAC